MKCFPLNNLITSSGYNYNIGYIISLVSEILREHFTAPCILQTLCTDCSIFSRQTLNLPVPYKNLSSSTKHSAAKNYVLNSNLCIS